MNSPAKRTFTAEDQRRFAALTGDVNPIHMDPEAARRTQAQRCAVHGVHVALWALEALAAGEGRGLGAVTVRFNRFILVGDPVEALVKASSADAISIEVRSGTQAAVTLKATFGQASVAALGRGRPPAGPEPTDLGVEALAGTGGEVGPPEGADPQVLFPALVRWIGARAVTELALLSTVVGMCAPGLHSIFASFKVALAEASGEVGLAYAVKRVDPRFRLATVEIGGGGVTGELDAFVRFSPVQTPNCEAIAARVSPGRFGGERALIIGASRGLGAAAAKIIAAGGGDVTLTYASGKDDAEAVCREIDAAFGPGHCRALALDVTSQGGLAAAVDLSAVTWILYFATPSIFHQAGGVFDSDRFAVFADVYAGRFAELVERLVAARRAGEGLRVFYPSSVAVDERPRHMTEYAMAKAAGEILSADLMRAHRGLTIDVARLPRVRTDQTATVPPVAAADAAEVMLDVLGANCATLESGDLPKGDGTD